MGVFWAAQGNGCMLELVVCVLLVVLLYLS